VIAYPSVETNMEIIVKGEIIFRLSGFESVVCMKRDVRELGRPYRHLLEKGYEDNQSKR
jgi:hypothetical protein